MNLIFQIYLISGMDVAISTVLTGKEICVGSYSRLVYFRAWLDRDEKKCPQFLLSLTINDIRA